MSGLIKLDIESNKKIEKNLSLPKSQMKKSNLKKKNLELNTLEVPYENKIKSDKRTCWGGGGIKYESLYFELK